VTTLAAMDRNIFPYDPEKIHGLVLPRDNIQHLFEDLKSKSLEQRLEIPSLERGREDLIIAGTALVLETMEVFQCSHLTVSEYSLREGILLQAFQNR
jgi:exopolyphosphatase/guanosine-5'-triphosphate,3'-diphosphate pyrophosphatase